MKMNTIRWLLHREEDGESILVPADVDGPTVAVPEVVADKLERATVSARIERIRGDLDEIETVLQLRESAARRKEERERSQE